MPSVRPAALRRSFDDLGGQSVSFLERAGDDPPVVLIHGWGASAATFRVLLEGSGTGRRLLAVDLPGFGDSPLGGGGWTTARYADLVANWLDRRGPGRPSLLGHSYGGAVAMRLAAGDRGDRLLLCAASGIRPEAASSLGGRVRLFRLLRGLAGWLPEPLASSSKERLAQRFGSADYRAAAPELRPTLVAAVREDLSEVARTISVPTLVVWGSADPELPPEPHAERLRSLIPGAELVVLEGSGHFPFLDQPQRFARVFDALMDADI